MAYNYIQCAYGRCFEPGQRVVFTEYDNKPGTVMRPQGDPQYVRVRFDDGMVGDCHPLSVEPVTKTVVTLCGQDIELKPL